MKYGGYIICDDPDENDDDDDNDRQMVFAALDDDAATRKAPVVDLGIKNITHSLSILLYRRVVKMRLIKQSCNIRSSIDRYAFFF